MSREPSEGNELQALKDEIKRLKKEMEDLAKGQAKNAKQRAALNDAKEDLKRSAEDLETWLKTEVGKHIPEGFFEEFRERLTKTREQVKKQPLLSLAAALGLGILLGRIAPRR